jgi:hypothetical protein
MDDISTLRHLIATLAYRAAKIVRDAPPDFPTFAAASSTRPPVLIMGHLGDLIAWGLSLCDDTSVWQAGGGGDWDAEVQRFFRGLESLDDRLSKSAVSDDAIEKLIQGPLADALTHVGQLALLRGMAGVPVRPESYARAPITRGRVGLDQGSPGREFDGDASVRR